MEEKLSDHGLDESGRIKRRGINAFSRADSPQDPWSFHVSRSVGVGVAVVMVAVGADGFGTRWGGAAVGGFAAADLELDSGVGDVEAVAQGTVDGVQNGGAFREGHLRDEDVAGERVGRGAEGPDVEIVDVEDAGNAADGGADVRG